MPILKSAKLGSSSSSPGAFPFSGEYSVARRKMVEELRLRGIRDERVLEVMGKIPRHRFVEEALISQAYQDTSLHIGFGQTISQPYTVAILAQSLHLRGHESILEIGTGCGYQTAILACLAKQIYSIERLHSLILKARSNLKRLHIKNVILKYGDGSQGWQQYAPFDSIVAAAVSPQIPQPLLHQLLEGGRLVVPIQREEKQNLLCIVRKGDEYHEQILESCRFVKMVGKHAFHDQAHESHKKEVHSGRKIFRPHSSNRRGQELPLPNRRRGHP